MNDIPESELFEGLRYLAKPKQLVIDPLPMLKASKLSRTDHHLAGVVLGVVRSFTKAFPDAEVEIISIDLRVKSERDEVMAIVAKHLGWEGK